MTRLAWGAVGERVYEAGADRGVLYINNFGYAWNGLTSVKEAPSGGDPSPYYLDGVKYANVSAAEEYEATIEALSSPDAFGQCDGTLSLRPGLYVTQQPRKSFGLSYRTLIGNDLSGLNYGYKLHLVYNAMAAPSDRENATISATPGTSSLSWGITTVPPQATGYRPTAHMVVDSRQTNVNLLHSIEDILYGAASSAPRLPTQTELIALFTAYS